MESWSVEVMEYGGNPKGGNGHENAHEAQKKALGRALWQKNGAQNDARCSPRSCYKLMTAYIRARKSHWERAGHRFGLRWSGQFAQPQIPPDKILLRPRPRWPKRA